MADARELLLDRVLGYAAAEGVTDKSLREIATGVGTSHRMLIYHFGSREGLLAAIVAEVERQQRAVLTQLADADATTAGEVMLRLWDQVSDPALRPYVRLFFSVVGLAVQGVAGTEALLATLTDPWLAQGEVAAGRLGLPADPAALRLGVAASRGLLLDLLAGADADEVGAAYRLLVDMWQRWAEE